MNMICITLIMRNSLVQCKLPSKCCSETLVVASKYKGIYLVSHYMSCKHAACILLDEFVSCQYIFLNELFIYQKFLHVLLCLAVTFWANHNSID